MNPSFTQLANATIDRPRLQAIIAHLGCGLIERGAQARGLVLAALCGEHVLFIGPPGTAKSELARRLHAVVGGLFFERLLTRFTVPEELFGPLSLAALDAGRYERDVQGYLPTAAIAFLDEVFKANSAILNALLTLLNERVFDQGASRMATPLVTVVAASNEVPEDDALRAFYDRFLLRCPVLPVSDDAFEQLLAARPAPLGEVPQIHPDEIARVQALAQDVAVPEAIVSALAELRRLLQARSLTVSDRRWVRIVRALRIAAWANQRAWVDWSDLWITQFMVCERLETLPLVVQWWRGLLSAQSAIDPQWLGRVVQAFEQQIELESGAAEVAFDDSGKLALMRSLGGADDQAMSDSAPRLSAFSRPRRYSATHIAARLAQIDGVLVQIADFLARGAAHESRVSAELQANLWLEPAAVAMVTDTLRANHARVSVLHEQLRCTRDAFAALPLADRDDGKAPAAVSPDAG